MIIDNELLAAYAEGNVSQEEREAIRQYLADNPDKMESVLFAMEDFNENDDANENRREGYNQYIENLGIMVDEIEGNIRKPLTINHKSSILPMTAMAAQNTIGNLCVIKCEGMALRHFGFEVNDDDLLKESEREGWLCSEGTALHNIGRLCGKRGLSVSHRYHCTIEDVQEALSAGDIVIAAIDGNELMGNYAEEQQKDIEMGLTPNHAVMVQSITADSVYVIDPAITPSLINPDGELIELQPSIISHSRFVDAWEDSSNCLIIISNSDEYVPHPISLDDVEVEDELIELREAIAENAHEVWAEARRNEGWKYGTERDDAKKQHPDMLPYNRLPESEKEYDRIMAMNTIKLVKKLGWDLKKKK